MLTQICSLVSAFGLVSVLLAILYFSLQPLVVLYYQACLMLVTFRAVRENLLNIS